MESRIHLDQQMDGLFRTARQMGRCVAEALVSAAAALASRDPRDLDRTRELEEKSNALLKDIEDRCVSIIATEQPVAGDLREVMSAMRFGSNLERIGDHALHLARASRKVQGVYLEAALPLVRQMVGVETEMVRDVVNAFIARDDVAARRIAARDDEIDGLSMELYRAITKLLEANPADAEQVTVLAFVSRFMERVGDHIANICEWVCYARTGRHEELNE